MAWNAFYWPENKCSEHYPLLLSLLRSSLPTWEGSLRMGAQVYSEIDQGFKSGWEPSSTCLEDVTPGMSGLRFLGLAPGLPISLTCALELRYCSWQYQSTLCVTPSVTLVCSMLCHNNIKSGLQIISIIEMFLFKKIYFSLHKTIFVF